MTEPVAFAVDRNALQTQLQQAVETLRFQTGLLVQVWGFLIAADAVLVGYALSQKQAFLLLVASATPPLMLFAAWRTVSYELPIAYVAIRIERELLPNHETVTASYVRIRHPAVYQQIVAALELSDVADRYRLIGATRFSNGPSRELMPALFLVGTISHLCLFVLSLTTFHYKLM
jgi:hypothetical protein